MGKTRIVYHPSKPGVTMIIPAKSAEKWKAQGWYFTDPFAKKTTEQKNEDSE